MQKQTWKFAVLAASNFIVPKVRVIGEERLKSITTLVDKAIVKAKQIVVPIFGVEGLVLILAFAAFLN